MDQKYAVNDDLESHVIDCNENGQKKNKVAQKAVLLVCSVFVIMQSLAMSPIIPVIVEDYADFRNIEFWSRMSMSMASFGVAIFAFPVGHLADKIGFRRILLTGLVIFAVLGTAPSYLQPFTAIIVFRFFLGMGTAAIMSISTGLISLYYDGEEKMKMMGFQAAAIGSFGFVVTTVSGVLGAINWRYSFIIYTASLLPFPFVYKYIVEPKPISKSKPKPKSKPKSESKTKSESESESNSNSFGNFKFFKLRMRISRKTRKLSLLLLCVFYVQCIFFVFAINVANYMGAIFGAESTESGITFGVTTLLASMFSICSGFIIRRVGPFPLLSLVFIVIPIAEWLLFLTTDRWTLYIALLLAGAGLGCGMPVIPYLISITVSEKRAGAAMGIFTALTFLGQFSAPFVNLILLGHFKITFDSDYELPIDRREDVEYFRFFFMTLGICTTIIFLIVIPSFYFKKVFSQKANTPVPAFSHSRNRSQSFAL